MARRTVLDDLREQQERINEMQSYIAPLVRQARATGASWSAIGEALGISKQAAWDQFKRYEVTVKRPK